MYQKLRGDVSLRMSVVNEKWTSVLNEIWTTLSGEGGFRFSVNLPVLAGGETA